MEPTQRGEGAPPALDPVLGAAPYPVLALNPAGAVTGLNDAARSLLGVRPGKAPDGVLPGWLAEAHLALVAGSVTAHAEPGGRPPGPVAHGPIGDRFFAAHAVPAAGPGASQGHSAGTVWWLSDVTENRRLERELAAERERTSFLVDASSQLLASLNLERCMEVTARLAARHLADGAVVIAFGSGRYHPVTYCGPGGHVEHRELLVDPAEVPGLAEAMQAFPPVPPCWIDPAAAPGWVARADVGEIGAMVVIALPGQGVPAGALVLLRRGGRRAFSGGEEIMVRLFAARAGAAMSAARVYAEQASITDTLMRGLRPPPTTELPGVELAARYRPSGDAEHVGGDFYDVHPAAGGPGGTPESLVVLGDVCGKGLEAAVLTGKIRNTLGALISLAGDHQRVLELLNGTLLNSGSTRFVTLVLASVRQEGGRVRLRLTSAGHAAPLIVRSGGEVRSAETRGSLIGVLEEITSTTATVLLEPGDTCLLYTDGITEAVGGPLGDEMFGEERLRGELRGCGGMPPEALVERVHMLASEWVGGGAHDDIALVAITAPRRVRPSAAGEQRPERSTS